MTHESLVLMAFATPLVGALLIAMAGRVPNVREAFVLLTAVITFACVAALYPAVIAGKEIHVGLFDMVPGVPLAFHVEPLGLVYALLAGLLWIPNSLYSIGYMRGNAEAHQTRFYVCFALAMAGAIGIAFADNLLTLFIFYEVLTLSTYPLVTHKGTPAAVRSARTYLGVLLVTSVGLQLLALLWIYAMTLPAAPGASGIEFTLGGVFREGLATGAVSPAVVGVLFFLYIYGIGKAALMPAHRWLPAAMVAPTPVSAFLHAVAVVKAGVFCVVKVAVYVFSVGTLREYGIGEWLLYAAGATILIASLVALHQDDLKKRLAYSTVSQLSYVILAVAIFTPLSIMAATIHIVAHAFGKITLFFAAGSIYTAAGKSRVSELDGIGRRMPWTMGAFAVGTLSMVGIPPVFGFVSKWHLLRGIAQDWSLAGEHIGTLFALAVIVCGTLLSAGYLVPIVYRAFFRPLSDEARRHPHGESPAAMVYALCFTAALTLLFFFWHRPVADLAELVRRAVV